MVCKYCHLTSQDTFDNKTMWSSKQAWFRNPKTGETDSSGWPHKLAMTLSYQINIIRVRAIKNCTVKEIRAWLCAHTSSQQSARDSGAINNKTRAKLSSSVLSKLFQPPSDWVCPSDDLVSRCYIYISTWIKERCIFVKHYDRWHTHTDDDASLLANVSCINKA